jgi:hypothetical protein
LVGLFLSCCHIFVFLFVRLFAPRTDYRLT